MCELHTHLSICTYFFVVYPYSEMCVPCIYNVYASNILLEFLSIKHVCIHAYIYVYSSTSVLGDPRREQPPAVYGHVINVPTHFIVKLPLISGHLPNADADSHLLVVITCSNRQCKQMPRFRWSFQPKIAGAHQCLF